MSVVSYRTINDSSSESASLSDSQTDDGHGGGPPVTSTLRTFINFFKSYIGSGILGLPYAFLEGGVLFSIFSIMLLGVLSNYCIRLLLQCSDALENKHGRLSFGALGGVIYGRVGRIVVDVSLIFTQVGFCCVYVIFIGDNLNGIYSGIPSWGYVIMVMPFFILISWVREYKYLAFTSLFGQIAIFFGLGVISVYALISTIENTPKIYAINWKGLPVFFGMAVYTFEGIGTVIPMRSAMKHQERYTFILDIGYILMTATFIFFGTIGYTGYGANVNPGGITLNLPQGSIWTILTLATLVFSIFTSYPIQMFPVICIIEGLIFKKNRLISSDHFRIGPISISLFWRKNVVRTLLVITTSFIAISIPYFSLFVSLIGSVGSSTLAFILPCLFHFKLFKATSSKYLIIFNGFIVVFGIVASLISASVTIYQLITAISDSL